MKDPGPRCLSCRTMMMLMVSGLLFTIPFLTFCAWYAQTEQTEDIRAELIFQDVQDLQDVQEPFSDLASSYDSGKKEDDPYFDHVAQGERTETPGRPGSPLYNLFSAAQADGKEQPTAKEPLGIIQRGFVSEEEIEETLGFVPVKETLEEKYQREWARIGSQADLDRNQPRDEAKKPEWKKMEEILSKLEKKSSQAKKETGKVFYSNGDEYYGDLYGEWPQGIGFMLYKDGSEYEGQWEMGRRCGEGRYVDRSGDITSVYTGHWRNDMKTFEGRIEFSTGDVYQGGWINNMYYGYGELSWKQWIFKGMFLYGLMEGGGELLYSDGTIFVGEWRRGNPTGVGKLHYPDGQCSKVDWGEEGPNLTGPCV